MLSSFVQVKVAMACSSMHRPNQRCGHCDLGYNMESH